jgi:hypothetical protein
MTLMALIFRCAVLFALVSVGFPRATSAEVVSREKFSVSGWSTDAWFEDGSYSHCTAAADFDHGTSLIFGISRGSYLVSLASLAWQLDLEKSYPVELAVDSSWQMTGEANAFVKGGIYGVVVSIGRNSVAVSALKNGSQLWVQAQSGRFGFRLKGSRAAIEAIEACDTRYAYASGSSRRESPFAAPSSQRSNPFSANSDEESALPFLESAHKRPRPIITREEFEAILEKAAGEELIVTEVDREDRGFADYIGGKGDGIFTLYREEETSDRLTETVLDDIIRPIEDECAGRIASGRTMRENINGLSVHQGFSACDFGDKVAYFGISIIDFGATASIYITFSLGDNGSGHEFDARIANFLLEFAREDN